MLSNVLGVQTIVGLSYRVGIVVGVVVLLYVVVVRSRSSRCCFFFGDLGDDATDGFGIGIGCDRIDTSTLLQHTNSTGTNTHSTRQ